MKKSFVIRGQTLGTPGTGGKDNQEVLNFSGFKPGYAFRLVEFQLYNSTNIGTTEPEMCASISAGKQSIDPRDPNFNDEALIATAIFKDHNNAAYGLRALSVINDTFLITQNLILTVYGTASAGTPVNWQCRFESVKMSGPEEAVANYKQFTISDGS